MTGSMRRSLRFTFEPPRLRKSLAVALVVGTVLNLINQWEAVVGGAPIDLWKLVLTYMVPFCVSSYGIFTAYRHALGLYPDLGGEEGRDRAL